MSGQIFEGKTVEEALQKAASELGVAVESLEHEAAGDKGGDFWGLGEPAVRVQAWVRVEEEVAAPPEPAGQQESAVEEPASPAQVPQSAQHGDDSDGGDEAAANTNAFFAPAPAARPESDPAGPPVADPQVATEPEAPAGEMEADEPTAESAPPSEGEATEPGRPAAESPTDGGGTPSLENLEEATVSLLNSIFAAMDFDCSAEARIDGEALLVAISGDDNEYLLEGRGRGLSALELILNHAFRHRAGDEHKKIHVDAGDFRARREDEIRDLAYQVSHQAKETGTEQETQPLNPYERRIVHLTLADDEQVTTRSRGSGFMKSVSIIPTHGQR